MAKIVKISKKICMLGTFGVGKTSLVRRFVFDKFEEKYQSTIGVLIHQKTLTSDMLNLKDEPFELNLVIWDLAHIEKFDPVIKNYFRGSHGAIVVLDITRPDTIENLGIFLRPFMEINPNSKLILALNKVDLNDKSEITVEQFLPDYKIEKIFTSARTGENVEQLFIKLGILLMK